MEKDHGLRIPNEASIHKNPKRLGWGRRIGQIDFGAFGILSAELQAPMFFINQPLFLQKLSIYIHIPNIYSGLEFDKFGLQIIRDLAFVCP